jgi:hypothetical protein
LSLLGIQLAHLLLDLIQSSEVLQRFLGDYTLVIGPQIVEFAPRVRETARS